MKRLVLVLCLCGLLAVPAIATGAPFPPDNEFQGRVAGDPNTYFGFDLSGRKRHQKVRHVSVALPMACYSGDQGMNETRVRETFDLINLRVVILRSPPRGHNGGHGVRRNVRSLRFFDGEGDVESDLGPGEAYLYGQIRRHGKVRGYINVHTEDPTLGKCYSGGLSLRAKRGVHVTYPPAP